MVPFVQFSNVKYRDENRTEEPHPPRNVLSHFPLAACGQKGAEILRQDLFNQAPSRRRDCEWERGDCCYQSALSRCTFAGTSLRLHCSQRGERNSMDGYLDAGQRFQFNLTPANVAKALPRLTGRRKQQIACGAYLRPEPLWQP